MRSRFVPAASVAILLVLAACSDSKSLDTLSTTAAADATTSTVSSTSTSAAGGTTTVASAGTVPAATSVVTLPPYGTELGQPTNLAPDVGTIFLPGDLANCDSDPGMPGFHNSECVASPSFSDGLVVMVQQENGDGHYRVVVFFKQPGSADYASRFVATEPGAGTWSNVHVEVGDYNADDGVEVWVGYRVAGTGGYLDLDVLDPRPDGSFFLGGLQGLAKGRVDVQPGSADVISAVYAGSDPNCCPSTMLLQKIIPSAGTWRINTGTAYPTASAPPSGSDFP